MEKADTPLELGYRMPAEWERHEATWLSWPKNSATFPPAILSDVEKTYLKMMEALQEGERVDVLIDDDRTASRVSSMLHSTHNIFFHIMKSADVWVRDYGPIFIKDKNSVALTKWIFNAWGRKYDDLLPDDETGLRIASSTGKRIFESNIVLEGGSIDANGRGTILTTRQCLLNKNRNPQLDRRTIERYLRDYLAVTNPIWLDSGIAGDDTDGHVDDVARFVNADTILVMAEENVNDENHQSLLANYETLAAAKDQDGRKLNVVTVQMPKRVDSEEGRLPASYANFYIGNSAVLVPTFDDPNDQKAVQTINSFFPERKVIGINCKSMVWGFGSIHCVTQQQPGELIHLV